MISHDITSQYVSVPCAIACNEELSRGALTCYVRLACWGDAEVPQQRLARSLGCSIRSLRIYLNELVTLGAMTVERQVGDHGQRPNRYIVAGHPARQPEHYPAR